MWHQYFWPSAFVSSLIATRHFVVRLFFFPFDGLGNRMNSNSTLIVGLASPDNVLNAQDGAASLYGWHLRYLRLRFRDNSLLFCLPLVVVVVVVVQPIKMRRHLPEFSLKKKFSKRRRARVSVRLITATTRQERAPVPKDPTPP